VGTKILRSIPFPSSGKIEKGNLFITVLDADASVLRHVFHVTGAEPG
jgi:hypothetical protein